MITASVRLSRKKAPIMTSGTKKMTALTFIAFQSESMMKPQPYSVTHWNTVIMELKILSKLFTPPARLCTSSLQ